MNTTSNEDVEEIRYCKKCGCELTSTNKRKLCENCRRARNKKIRELVVGVGSTAVGLVLIAPKLLCGFQENTSSDDSDSENNDYSDIDSESDY